MPRYSAAVDARSRQLRNRITDDNLGIVHARSAYEVIEQMDHKTQEVDFILSRLARVATLPMERATTIPAQAYTNDAFLALELEEIFAKEWVCVGRLDEVPHSGDYFATELA